MFIVPLPISQSKLLTPLIRHIINASYESMNYNVPFVRKTLAIAAGTAAAVVAGGVWLYKASKNRNYRY